MGGSLARCRLAAPRPHDGGRAAVEASGRMGGSRSASVPSRDRRRSCASTGAAASSSPTTEFAPLRARFGTFDAVRSVIRVALTRIADSCGYGVPRYRFEGEREQLREWAQRKGKEG